MFIAYTINTMNDAYDTKKNQENILKHAVSFEDVALFEWDTAITTKDARKEYGESRFVSYGLIGERLHVLVWTRRDGTIRPISFRKANKRERRFYEQKI